MSNIQKSQNSKTKAIRTSQNYKSERKIKFLNALNLYAPEQNKSVQYNHKLHVTKTIMTKFMKWSEIETK